jgi:hypothetical protein
MANNELERTEKQPLVRRWLNFFKVKKQLPFSTGTLPDPIVA